MLEQLSKHLEETGIESLPHMLHQNEFQKGLNIQIHRRMFL